MLRREDSELLTRVGPGTPMGEMMREYWAPAVRAAALEADGAPVRVRMFGENFVAFRGTNGQVGFVDEGCPHRGASLALARNEDNALRCIFHGWKIDLNGKIVEAPCEPELRRDAFAATVKVGHYAVREAGGMIWVYLGKRETPPQFPEFEFNNLPASHVHFRRATLHYNWLQGLEAHLDAAHLGVLHSGFQNGDNPQLALAMADKSPRIEMDVTPYGLREGALRDQADGTVYSRIRQIVLPFFTFIPFGPDAPCSGRATVPIDDEYDAEWYILYDPNKPLTQKAIDNQFKGASGDPDNFAANLGNVGNMWNQDRAAMKNGHFSGLQRNIPFEDFTVQESMGPMVDREKEQLGASDAILVHVRRLLLDAVRGFQQGKPAPWQAGVDYAKVRAMAKIHPKATGWRELVPATEIIADEHGVAAQ